jgi:hypothetical protein
MAKPDFDNHDGYWCIRFWADGSDLKMTERTIGPFPTHEDAYEFLCTLPAPINGGHKFIEPLEMPVFENEPVDISELLVQSGTTFH